MRLTNIEQTELALKGSYDNEAFADLVLSITKPAWDIIHKKMAGCSDMDKEDMYQDIMLALCCSIKNFKGKSLFYVWFRSLMQHKIADYYRQSSRVFYMAVPESHEQMEAEWYSIHDELSLVCTRKDVDIVYNIAVKGYTYSELADKDGQEYEKVRSDYRRAKARVRAKIGKQWR